MSRIQNKFSELRLKGQKALISYMVAGYPDEQTTISAVRGLVKGGTDIIELGLPFSDPLADGPTIQNASYEALQKGMNPDRFVELVKKIRMETDIPIVLMTYTNLAYSHGYEKFISDMRKAGIDGVILPDMPIEESNEYLEIIRKNGMNAIFLISPNTSRKRIKQISEKSSGFVYLVSVYGTTGTRNQLQQYTIDAIKNSKKLLGGKIPLAVGFGVGDAEQVRSILKAGADAVIVGSAFLRIIAKTPHSKIESNLASFTKSLKKATITE